MSSRRKRAKRRAERQGADRGFRAFIVRASSIDEETRSIEADIATETPVIEFDWDRYEYIPTVLLSEGLEMPRSGQVPLLDSHYPRNVANQVGSIRDVRKEEGRNPGRLYFSEAAEDHWTKTREGHVTDVSAGFVIVRKTYVTEGKTKKIRGREFTGPVNVATKWRLLEGSITPIGADEQAKMRGCDPAVLFPEENEEFEMNEELRALLIERGMPEDLDDDAAQKWLVENGERVFSSAEADDAPPPEERRAAGDGPSTPTEHLTVAQVRELLREERERERTERQQFRTAVDQLLEISGDVIDAEFAARCHQAEDIDSVRELILERRRERETATPTAPVIQFGAAQRDKHVGAVGTALLMRALDDCQIRDNELRERHLPTDRRSTGWEDFRHASLYDMAVECLRADGIETRGLSRDEVAMIALGFGDQVHGFRSNPAYHVTGSFPVLTQDAMNKSMMVGHEEFPSTWRIVGTIGSSVSDFKTIHRMAIGSVPNLPIWNDNNDPNQASFADAEETYAVECRSVELTFSYKTIVNDDMTVIGRSHQKLGDAAARTVNAVFWAQITGNPTMRDGVALFATATGNRQRDNLSTGANAPSSTTIGTMTKLMMLMRGENTPENAESDDVLALMPSFIVGPAALRTTILGEVRSIADPNGSHSGVANLSNDLTPVIEPLLDADSATAYYLFADPRRVETVEVTFLQGQETPQVRTVPNPKRLSQDTIVLQTFGAKALDHRGMQKHTGAA